jgi:hypothetical protein
LLFADAALDVVPFLLVVPVTPEVELDLLDV